MASRCDAALLTIGHSARPVSGLGLGQLACFPLAHVPYEQEPG
jgi:hypothetical protein